MTPLNLLTRAWRQRFDGIGPLLLKGDSELLGLSHVVMQRRSWNAAAREQPFARSDARFHLSLMPQPFFGDLKRARVFVLVLNPGLKRIDYFSELRVREYRDALVGNLRQHLDRDFPNIWFDPRFAWHSGASYWNRRFAPIVDEFSEELGSRLKALSFISKSVAVLQLVPYHSARFKLPDRVNLESTRLAVNFVSRELRRRAKRGEVALVVGRQTDRWNLGDAPKLKYHTRTAYLTRETREELLGFLRDLLRGDCLDR